MQDAGKVVSLVKRPISQDALQAAEALVRRIKSGETAGFALAEMHTIKDWTYDAAGWCRENPALTRGHVCGLDDELAKLTGTPAPSRPQ